MSDQNRSHLTLNHLTVIEGDAKNSSSSGVTLSLAPDLNPSKHQLSLPGISPSRSVLTTSPLALRMRNMECSLRDWHVRQIVDMRLAAEFSSMGLDRRGFDTLIERLGVHYWHAHELAGRGGYSRMSELERQERFRSRLCQDPARAGLLKLRQLINDGPVVLISESPRYVDSERAVVVDMLLRLYPGFSVQQIDPV